MYSLNNLTQALVNLRLAGTRPRADGRVSLSFDGGRRLDVYQLADGRLVLEILLTQMSSFSKESSALMERVLWFSTSQMPERHDVVSLLADGRSFALQSEIPADTSALVIELKMEQFMNAADTWLSMLSPESVASQGGEEVFR